METDFFPMKPDESEKMVSSSSTNGVPDYELLQSNMEKAADLVSEVVLKKYLYDLSSLEVVPLDDTLKGVETFRLFKITEMVYQKNEYSTYKIASVLNAVQNLNCAVFIIMDSNGERTDFYMGVRSMDKKRTTSSLKETLKNALKGQFPGVKTQNLLDQQALDFWENVPSDNIAAVSCVANNKDDDFKNNDNFLQGLEKLALAMQGQRYTVLVLAKSTPPEQLQEVREAYETIYSQLSPFANMQVSYGSSMALNVSRAFSHSNTTGSSHSESTSKSVGTNSSTSNSTSESTTKKNMAGNLVKSLGTAVLSTASVAAAPLTGGASLAAAALINAGNTALLLYDPGSKTKGTSKSVSTGKSESLTTGITSGRSQSETAGRTDTEGTTEGTSNNMQLTMQNKTLQGILNRIDMQLKRMEECESFGMWESAAYFLAETQETAEMAAGTYKALMKGKNSGVEVSSINFWGRSKKEERLQLKEYLTNFIHPVFLYQNGENTLPVTACSLVSSNELAIHMGLPRKSVCGFPVAEHAPFNEEVVSLSEKRTQRDFGIGNVYSMGEEKSTRVRLDADSLTMHTFVTGSTGAGKSNTIYELLNQTNKIYNVPFLIVEPAKGEYKDVFGGREDVAVYGTNPQLTELLRINPFSFPARGIHVLEHLDRLVEIFNVCWPMYAAMPAILKDACERAYVAAGWNLVESVNQYDDGLFPTFADVLEQIKIVVNETDYSADTSGDYKGALVTRVKSLTTGLNGQIFTPDALRDEDLFDKNVIVDLSRVGSTETKALLMGLLVMKLQEYRMARQKGTDSDLRHVTVLEEAHNLLKRTSTEQSSDSANLLGKSVEMLGNAIAEMRTYGEGFIIADQAPGLMDMAVIRNTNTKIIMRLPDQGDRELVGKAAGLNDDQIKELAKLPMGVAAVYQNEWLAPVLCKVDHFTDRKEYAGHLYTGMLDLDAPQIAENVLHILTDHVLPENPEDFRRQVLAASMTASLKCRLLQFIEVTPESRTKEQTLSLCADIAAEFFNAEDRLSRFREKELSDADAMENYLKEIYAGYLADLNEQEQQKLLTYIIEGARARDSRYAQLADCWHDNLNRKGVIV